MRQSKEMEGSRQSSWSRWQSGFGMPRWHLHQSHPCGLSKTEQSRELCEQSIPNDKCDGERYII